MSALAIGILCGGFVWIVCGVFAYGVWLANLQRHWPTVAAADYDRDVQRALSIAIGGPFGLVLALTIRWGRHGLMFRRPAMNYEMTTPCDECPFLKKMAHGFTLARLRDFASAEFACHRACDTNDDGEFVPRSDETPHCAGALIFNEKRNRPHQMMRIAERIGMYYRAKLNMKAAVR